MGETFFYFALLSRSVGETLGDAPGPAPAALGDACSCGTTWPNEQFSPLFMSTPQPGVGPWMKLVEPFYDIHTCEFPFQLAALWSAWFRFELIAFKGLVSTVKPPSWQHAQSLWHFLKYVSTKGRIVHSRYVGTSSTGPQIASSKSVAYSCTHGAMMKLLSCHKNPGLVPPFLSLPEGLEPLPAPPTPFAAAFAFAAEVQKAAAARALLNLLLQLLARGTVVLVRGPAEAVQLLGAAERGLGLHLILNGLPNRSRRIRTRGSVFVFVFTHSLAPALALACSVPIRRTRTGWPSVAWTWS